MATRLGLSMAAGLMVTLALFYLMQALIQGADSALTEDAIGNLVDFVRVKQDPELQTKKVERPPPPDEDPPEVPPQEFDVTVDDADFTMADVSVGVNIGGGGFAITDGEYLPIVKVQPQYPRRALTRGMTGWVIVEFTVTSLGTVENPVVLESCGWVQNARNTGECVDSPSSVFNSAAIKAALKFKYKPKVIDGDPVDTAGVQNKITFELLEE
ncbi:MAG: energy transducer TonB [Pseudomonadales bacterium]